MANDGKFNRPTSTGSGTLDRPNGSGSGAGSGTGSTTTTTGSEAPHLPADHREQLSDSVQQPESASSDRVTFDAERIRSKGGRPLGSKTKKRRGRPLRQATFRPTPEAKTVSATKVPTDLAAIEGLLVSLHWIVAGLIHAPELQLEAGEAKRLAASVQKVLDQYEVVAASKTVAWIELVANMGAIYGARAYAIHLRKQAEALQRSGPIPINKQPQPTATGA